MKNVLLFIVTICICFSSVAQFKGNPNSGLYAEYIRTTKTRPALNNIRDYVGAKEYDEFSIKEYQGSPFLAEDFILGDIYLEGKLQHSDIPLRYNAYKDQFEIDEATQQEGVVTYMDKGKGVSVRVSQRSFIVLPYAEKGTNKELKYFEALYLGSKVQLYKRNIQIFTPRKEALTSMTPAIPAKFTPSEVFYAMWEDKPMTRLPNAINKIYKFFGADRDAIKDFSKKYRLDLRSEKDLKRLFTFYNSI